MHLVRRHLAPLGHCILRSVGMASHTHTHPPGLSLPPGHALSLPLGVGRQVINQLAAYLVGGLERVSLLKTGNLIKPSLKHKN